MVLLIVRDACNLSTTHSPGWLSQYMARWEVHYRLWRLGFNWSILTNLNMHSYDAISPFVEIEQQPWAKRTVYASVGQNSVQ